ncbi:hypothetical protein Hypma_012661 [Hypsizygus marmoreus]|uniref:Uncharacterized protein n=1 Tax=Hypsizygus marmoreus TaxID=39966 RepID=A0A369JI19_HYPMA|nr:hypothetical protein Hypma_012661 [Hypsizygus marmoreus]
MFLLGSLVESAVRAAIRICPRQTVMDAITQTANYSGRLMFGFRVFELEEPRSALLPPVALVVSFSPLHLTIISITRLSSLLEIKKAYLDRSC